MFDNNGEMVSRWCDEMEYLDIYVVYWSREPFFNWWQTRCYQCGVWTFNGNRAIGIGASVSNAGAGVGAAAGFWHGDISEVRLSSVARYTTGVTMASGGT